MVLNDNNSIMELRSYEHYSGYGTVMLGTIQGVQIAMLAVIIFMLYLQQKQISRLEKKVMDVTGRTSENGTPEGMEEDKLLLS